MRHIPNCSAMPMAVMQRRFFQDDIARLVAGSEDVLITFTKDAYKLPARLPAPGFRRSLEELRFLKKDLERLAGKLKHEARPAQQQTQIQGSLNRYRDALIPASKQTSQRGVSLGIEHVF